MYLNSRYIKLMAEHDKSCDSSHTSKFLHRYIKFVVLFMEPINLDFQSEPGYTFKRILKLKVSGSCADPEIFMRGGPTKMVIFGHRREGVQPPKNPEITFF